MHMKLLSAVLALTAVATSLQAEAFFDTRSFDQSVGGLYDDPALNPSSIWPGQRTLSLTNPIQVEAGSLTYAGGGLPASVGNKVRLLNTGQDLSTPFTGGTITATEGNTYYFSAIMMVEAGAGNAGSATGDYPMHFANGQTRGADQNFSGTGFRGRLYLYDNGASGIGVGVQFSTDGATRANAATSAAFDEPFFVVVKITEVPGPDNDTAELFLFTSGAIPATEPGVASATSTGNGGTDNDLAVPIAQGGLGRVSLRQGTAADAPNNLLIDEIRSGSTWESVISNPSSVSDWSTM